MKMHLAAPLLLFLMFLTVALATGGALFFMLSALILLVMIFGLLSVLWASHTLRVTSELSEKTLQRGESAELRLTLRHRGFFPIAPVLIRLSSPMSLQREVRLRDAPGRIQELRMHLRANHVGVFPTGIQSCQLEDLLGIFQRTVVPENQLSFLSVYPQTFDVKPLIMAPGDPGSEMMSRATEDLSAPSDIREYQAGDAMKKIHWKLSLRKGELMVRKYEEPVLQDVLILMDCSRPPSWGHPQAEADLRDTLLETAASLFRSESETDHSVHMPLFGEKPVELDQQMGLPMIFDYLAHMDFSETDRFERVLTIESRRLRKTGCIVVISARLNSAMIDVMIRMHRMGPNVRLYLITFAPDDVHVLPLITRLQHASIETAYVVPEPADDSEGKQTE